MATRIQYMIRRALCSWKAKELVKESVAWCKKSKADEIVWKTESFGMYKELLPIPEIEKIVKNLRLAKKATEAAGMKYSINVFTTLSMGNWGNDLAAIHPGIEMMVGLAGDKSKSCPCPLSPAWRKLIVKTYSLYASTRPVRLWIDDDFRLYGHHHGQAAFFECYCNLHLAEFSKRIGRKIGRKELVNAILRPGKPDPLRAQWLAFLEEGMADAGALIRRAVHDESPDTQMGWMSSTPALHELEGRRYNLQLRSLMDKNGVAVRMCTTHYFEGTPRHILVLDEALKKVVGHLPEGTLKCTEIESFPHSLYNMSAARIGGQIAWACALNVPNQTLNLFDYIGTPMAETPLYGELLCTRKPEFDAIARCFARTPVMRGIGIPSDPASARYVHTTKGKEFTELMVREGGWIDPLRAFGIPIVYSRQEPVTAVTGQAFRCLSEDELRGIFSRGVLLDLSALQTLEAMGFGNLAGVRCRATIARRSRPIGCEELTDPAFAGQPYRYNWTYGLSSIGVLELQAGAKAISRIVDPDGRFLFHGFTIFENKLGGRVAVAPYNFAGADMDTYNKGPLSFFYSESRKEQIRAIVRWLGRGRVALVVDANGWILPHRADGNGCVALAAMNINVDPWQKLTMTCSLERKASKVLWMDSTGKWRTATKRQWRQTGHEFSLALRDDVPSYRMVAAFLELKDKAT